MNASTQIPLVAVIATGGTIASRKGTDGAASPALTGRDLLDLLPPMQVRLRAVELLAKDSSSLTLSDMQLVSDAVGAQLADPAIAGVVILHGTDAMEETALLVRLQHGAAKPVVFTGAQFSADSAQPDGPGNLADAIHAVLDGGDGVRLAFGGRLLPVWGLYKHASDRAEAFALAGGQAPALPALPASVAGLRVDIVALHPGADALHLNASIAVDAKGIVLAALGSGNTTAEVVAAVARATAAGIPVITSSRVPEGVLAPAYGGGGGGHDLMAAGAIHSRWLRPGQARILLAALLANGATHGQILRAFA
ncbi:asparaginase domain-containing protein [Paracoccus laeviglucosivorans]|uniref:Asparaginase n=1 Tax=Paracoccus laeviglucosivorans TaxID=1197861 RepID=A0A521B143_9RHOB|nr:asparaginase domain-containing protein [Paracoccus laeviglucosivorans]SMO40751.1 asparaginase [Paracoccus laeviglucosivorans]